MLIINTVTWRILCWQKRNECKMRLSFLLCPWWGWMKTSSHSTIATFMQISILSWKSMKVVMLKFTLWKWKFTNPQRPAVISKNSLRKAINTNSTFPSTSSTNGTKVKPHRPIKTPPNHLVTKPKSYQISVAARASISPNSTSTCKKHVRITTGSLSTTFLAILLIGTCRWTGSQYQISLSCG